MAFEERSGMDFASFQQAWVRGEGQQKHSYAVEQDLWEWEAAVAYALIDKGQCIFGADHTGGWHYHPFHDPTRHEPLSDAMTFAAFVAQIEQYYGLT